MAGPTEPNSAPEIPRRSPADPVDSSQRRRSLLNPVSEASMTVDALPATLRSEPTHCCPPCAPGSLSESAPTSEATERHLQSVWENSFLPGELLSWEEERRGGASQDVIDQLPVAIIQVSTHAGDYCSICLELPVVGAVVRRLPCMHAFHRECIDQWLHCQAVCPICKGAV